jgi:hypothetical protein
VPDFEGAESKDLLVILDRFVDVLDHDRSGRDSRAGRSHSDWRLFSLILKVPFFGVEDRSSIDQNLRKENPVSGIRQGSSLRGLGKEQEGGVGEEGCCREKEAPLARGLGDPPMPLDPERRNLF